MAGSATKAIGPVADGNRKRESRKSAWMKIHRHEQSIEGQTPIRKERVWRSSFPLLALQNLLSIRARQGKRKTTAITGSGGWGCRHWVKITINTRLLVHEILRFSPFVMQRHPFQGFRSHKDSLRGRPFRNVPPYISDPQNERIMPDRSGLRIR